MNAFMFLTLVLQPIVIMIAAADERLVRNQWIQQVQTT